jgi:hypothetical protein
MTQQTPLDGAALIAAERYRQVSEEGYAHSHDDKHKDGALTEAAQCYACVAIAEIRGSSAKEWPVEMFDGFNDSLLEWPLDDQYWKPSDDPLRNLAKAGALIAAEMDRIIRLRKNPPMIGSGAL